MAVPNTFANATGTLSLALLDTNFATGITIGNSVVQLGNTVTTLNNMTLANVTISTVASAIGAAQGGTGLTSPGTSGNVLTSTGSAWTSSTPSNLSGAKNRIINGAMAVDQRNAGASQTFTAGAALAYSVDRWYGYCTGANVTGARVTGSGSDQYRYQFTGAASVTAIGFGQRIEQLNSYDLNNSTVTLSVDLANSLLTTVTWTAYYANTADSFGTLASPTRTQIATGTFTVTSTVTRYSTQISVPAAATTGIEIVFSVGAQTSGTWTIGNVQLEQNATATAFERRLYGQELLLCQRYYSTSTKGYGYGYTAGAGNFRAAIVTFPATMRATPTIAFSGISYGFCGSLTLDVSGPTNFGAYVNCGGATAFTVDFTWTATAEI